jgi:hypothetical protein
MKVITPVTDLATGRSRYQVWEYDEGRARNVNAVDPRARYAVSRLVGSFATMAEAKLA